MVSRSNRSVLLLSSMLLPLLALAQAPASPSQAQNMPGMQMPGDEKPSAPQLHDTQTMPDMKTDDKMSGMALDDESKEPQMQGPPLKLSDLESMALSRNPTVAQATANLRAAEGAKKQAGLYPNPTVGYYGDEIRGGSFRSGKQGAFLNQTIILGGKLDAARRTAEQERVMAVTGIESQRDRVLTDVRTFYYEALAAESLVQLRRQLLALAKDAVQTSYQLENVGQADRPDVLQAEVEGEQARLDLESALQDQQSVWRILGAVVGDPSLPMSPLDGKLEEIPQLKEQEWMDKLLSDSPQVHSAEQDAERAKASLVEAKKVPIPDLQVSANLSQSNEPLEPSTNRVGLVGGAQIGTQIPLFNRNQGNVERAKAEVERSQREVERVQLELRRQMSRLWRDYSLAETGAERYRTSMLPRAQKAYELYRKSYENMAAAYPQVLISQRTLFQLQVDYIRALESVWVNAAAIQGYGLSNGLDTLTGGVPSHR